MQLHYYYILFLSWILLGSCRKVNNIPLRQTSSNDVDEKENLLLCPSGFDNRRYDIGFGLYTKKKSMDKRNLKLGNFKPNIDTFGRNDVDIKFYKVIPSLIESSISTNFLNNNGRSINSFNGKINIPVYQPINNIPDIFLKPNIPQFESYKTSYRRIPKSKKESSVEVETFKSIPLNFGNELDTKETQKDAPVQNKNFKNFFNDNHKIFYQLANFNGHNKNGRVFNSPKYNKKDLPKIVVEDRIRYIEFQNDAPLKNNRLSKNPGYKVQESTRNNNVEKFKSISKEIKENLYQKNENTLGIQNDSPVLNYPQNPKNIEYPNVEKLIENINTVFSYGNDMMSNPMFSNINGQEKIRNILNPVQNLQKDPPALYFRNVPQIPVNNFQSDMSIIPNYPMIQNFNTPKNPELIPPHIPNEIPKLHMNPDTMYLNHIRNAQNVHALKTVAKNQMYPNQNLYFNYNQNIPNNQLLPLQDVHITKSSEINSFSINANPNSFVSQNNIPMINGPQLFDNQPKEQNDNYNFQPPLNGVVLNENPFVPPKISDNSFYNNMDFFNQNIKPNGMQTMMNPMHPVDQVVNPNSIKFQVNHFDPSFPNSMFVPPPTQQPTIPTFRQPKSIFPQSENLVNLPENPVNNFNTHNTPSFQHENNLRPNFTFANNIEFIKFTKEDAIDVKRHNMMPNDGSMYERYFDAHRNVANHRNLYQNDKPAIQNFQNNFRRNDVFTPFNSDPNVAKIQLDYFKKVVNPINNNEIENNSTNFLIKNKNYTKYNKYENENYNIENGRKQKLMKSVLDLFERNRNRLQNNLNKNRPTTPRYEIRTNNRYLRPISGIFGKNEIFAIPTSRVDGNRKNPLHRMSNMKLYLARRTTDDESGKSELELLLPLPNLDEPKRQFRKFNFDKRIGKGEVRYGPDNYYTNLHPRLRTRYHLNKNNQWDNPEISTPVHAELLNQDFLGEIIENPPELDTKNKEEENQDIIEQSKKEKNKVLRLSTRFSVSNPLRYTNNQRDETLKNKQQKIEGTNINVSENNKNDFKTVPYESKEFGFDTNKFASNVEAKNYDSRHSTHLENLGSQSFSPFYKNNYKPVHEEIESIKPEGRTDLNNFKDFTYNNKNNKADQYADSTEETESEYGPTKLKPYKSNTDSELVQESFRKSVLDPVYENTDTYSRYTGGNKRNFVPNRLDNKRENINFNTYNKVNVQDRNKNILPHLLSDPKLNLNFQLNENDRQEKNSPRYDSLVSETNVKEPDYRLNPPTNVRRENRYNSNYKNRDFLIYEVNNPLNFLKSTLFKQNRNEAHSNHNYNIKNSLFPHLRDADRTNLKDNRPETNKHVIDQINQLEALKFREFRGPQQLKPDENRDFLRDIDYKTFQGLSLNDEGNGVSRDGKSRQRNLNRLIEAQRKSMSLNPPILPKNERNVLVEKADGLHIFLFH